MAEIGTLLEPEQINAGHYNVLRSHLDGRL